ncbi:MAG: hypothetical protein AAF236_02920, partial [Verrucomicrobiota bacterium]
HAGVVTLRSQPRRCAHQVHGRDGEGRARRLARRRARYGSAGEADTPGTLALDTLYSADAGSAKGVYYRVFEAEKGLDGTRKTLYSGGRADHELPPGEYFVTASIDKVSGEGTFTVEPGKKTDGVIDLNAGRVTVKVFSTEGGDEVSGNYFYFSEAALNLEGERQSVYSGGAKDFFLAAGDYHVRVRNDLASAEQEFSITPGKLTEVNLYYNAGIANVVVRATEGGEPLGTYNYLLESTVGLDGKRKSLKSGGHTKYFVPAGTYVLSSRWGIATGEVEFEVNANQATQVELILDAGRIEFTVVDEDGNEVRGYRWLSESATGLDGTRKGLQSGGHSDYSVPVGTYHIRVKDGDKVGELDGIVVEAGKTTKVQVEIK